MRPLSGLDASFVYAESDTAHMHTLKVLQLELSEPCAVDPLGSIRRGLAAWLPALPSLRFVLVRAPLKLGHPFWHEVAEVDLDAHVEHARVGADRGDEALEHALSAFASRPLSRDRPLWRLLVVEGLGPRRVALALKIHHALADGLAAAQLLRVVAAPAPPGPEPPARGRPGEGAPPPPLRLAGWALAERGRELASLGPVIAETLRGVKKRLARRGPPDEAHLFEGPRVSFDAPVTPRRSVALAGLDLDAVRGVKDRAGCHVNDVVLAIVAGALRDYLGARGEATDRPLVAAMPVGESDGEPHAWGNRVSNLLMPIHVEIAEPRARLEASARSAAIAKELHGLLGPRLLRRWSELSRPRVLGGLWRAVRHLSRPPVNLIVSNVPGPREALYVGGATLRDLHSVGPLLETTGLNLTFWSYAGRMNACVLACPDHGTDARALAAALAASARALVEAYDLPRAAE